MAGMRGIFVCLLVIVVCCADYGTKKSYKGFLVARVTLNGDADWLTLEAILANKSLELELWSAPTSPNDLVDIQVAARQYDRLSETLSKANIQHNVFIEDVQQLIETEEDSERYELLKDESLPHRVRRSVAARVSNKVVGVYAPLPEIETWMKKLAANFPGLVSLEDIGKTYEGRAITVMKLGRPLEGRVKPAVYLDGGIHSREWISPTTVIYIIYQLLTSHLDGEKEVRGYTYLDLVDWYFVPVANPDGYDYTHTHDRLWRKNRAPTSNISCTGTDLNRNWPYRWGKVTPYTSDKECSIVYHGSGPGSELETKALMAFLLRHNDTIKGFISHHSYTQKWFTRWGYTNSTPPDHEQLLSVAKKAVEAITEAGGEPYKVGRPFELLYAYTGGSADWAKGVAGIKYSYTVELRDRGRYGFLLPANYVVPVGEELFAAVKVVASQIINETYGNETYVNETEAPTTEEMNDTITKCSSNKTRDSCTNSTRKEDFNSTVTVAPAGGIGAITSNAVAFRFLWDNLLLLCFLSSCIWSVFDPS